MLLQLAQQTAALVAAVLVLVVLEEEEEGMAAEAAVIDLRLVQAVAAVQHIISITQLDPMEVQQMQVWGMLQLRDFKKVLSDQGTHIAV
jgi:hypothetical protein